MARMSKFTLLAGPAEGCRGGPPGGWGGKAGRRQRLLGVRDPGGERRLLFGVGDGSAEAIAGVKQENVGVARKQFEIAGNGRQPQLSQRLPWRLLSAKPVLTSRESASFLRQSPVVNHLSLTCSATCQPPVILVFA